MDDIVQFTVSLALISQSQFRKLLLLMYPPGRAGEEPLYRQKKFPGPGITFVPVNEPLNEAGIGLLPATVIAN